MKRSVVRTSPWASPDLRPGDTAAVSIGGLFMLALGIWAFFAPASFADFIAFPYNRHLLHDVGAFQIGIGRRCCSRCCGRKASWSCWPATLWARTFTSPPT